MAERVVWRPRWFVWPGLGIALLALLHGSMPWLLHGRWLFVVGVGLIAVLAVGAMLWELPPAGMMCGALVLTIFSGSWQSMGLPGFPFVPDRVLLVGVLLALVLHAPGTRELPRIRVRGAHLLLALTVLYATASAAATGTLGTKAGVFDLLDQLGAIPFLMLLVAPAVFASSRARDMLLRTLVGLGGYLGLTAFFEAFGPHALVFPSYIVASDAAGPFLQAGGPFQQPVTEGFACFSCAVAAAIAFNRWRGRPRRWIAGAVLVLCALGTFLPLERGVWIAAVAAVAAVALASREVRRRLAPASLVCVLVIGGALLVSPSLTSHASARSADQTSVWDRQNQTATGLRMIAAKPLFGFGWDRYKDESLGYFRQAPGYPMTGFSIRDLPLPLHNTYLSTAVELGLVGAFLWLGCLLWGIGGAILAPVSAEMRPWKLGLIAIAVFFAVVAFFDPLQQNFTQLLLWTWAGTVLAGTQTAPSPSRAHKRAQRRTLSTSLGAGT